MHLQIKRLVSYHTPSCATLLQCDLITNQAKTIQQLTNQSKVLLSLVTVSLLALRKGGTGCLSFTRRGAGAFIIYKNAVANAV